jgi:hypothetical protein
MESVYKRKGCGPQGLGSSYKQVKAGKKEKLEKVNEIGDPSSLPINTVGPSDPNKGNDVPEKGDDIKSVNKKANCWKGYKAVGKKKSPSGKKTKGGKTKMVNNCVKIK